MQEPEGVGWLRDPPSVPREASFNRDEEQEDGGSNEWDKEGATSYFMAHHEINPTSTGREPTITAHNSACQKTLLSRILGKPIIMTA